MSLKLKSFYYELYFANNRCLLKPLVTACSVTNLGKKFAVFQNCLAVSQSLIFKKNTGYDNCRFKINFTTVYLQADPRVWFRGYTL